MSCHHSLDALDGSQLGLGKTDTYVGILHENVMNTIFVIAGKLIEYVYTFPRKQRKLLVGATAAIHGTVMDDMRSWDYLANKANTRSHIGPNGLMTWTNILKSQEARSYMIFIPCEHIVIYRLMCSFT
jgi:hypothetical protein